MRYDLKGCVKRIQQFRQDMNLSQEEAAKREIDESIETIETLLVKKEELLQMKKDL